MAGKIGDTITCPECNQICIRIAANTIYCSSDCRWRHYNHVQQLLYREANKIEIRTCRICNKEFEPNTTHHVYCSSKCSQRGAGLKRNYKLDIVNVQDLFEKQDHRCAICEEEKPTWINLNIDHDHETNEIRGLLCDNCNFLLGHAKDNLATLKRAIEYLRKGGIAKCV